MQVLLQESIYELATYIKCNSQPVLEKKFIKRGLASLN